MKCISVFELLLCGSVTAIVPYQKSLNKPKKMVSCWLHRNWRSWGFVTFGWFGKHAIREYVYLSRISVLP